MAAQKMCFEVLTQFQDVEKYLFNQIICPTDVCGFDVYKNIGIRF